MGLNFLNSNSSYDEPIVKTIYKTIQKIVYRGKGNPNPKNFEIRKSLIINDFLIIRLLYPDCKNYEGNKVLVYDKGIVLDDLLKQKTIDPHFSNSKKFISPIARFVPTTKGWDMAVKLSKTL